MYLSLVTRRSRGWRSFIERRPHVKSNSFLKFVLTKHICSHQSLEDYFLQVVLFSHFIRWEFFPTANLKFLRYKVIIIKKTSCSFQLASVPPHVTDRMSEIWKEWGKRYKNCFAMIWNDGDCCVIRNVYNVGEWKPRILNPNRPTLPGHGKLSFGCWLMINYSPFPIPSYFLIPQFPNSFHKSLFPKFPFLIS